MTFATLQDRVDACESLAELDRLGRTLALQLATESAAMMLFRLSLALDARRLELLQLSNHSQSRQDARQATDDRRDGA